MCGLEPFFSFAGRWRIIGFWFVRKTPRLGGSSELTLLLIQVVASRQIAELDFGITVARSRIVEFYKV